MRSLFLSFELLALYMITPLLYYFNLIPFHKSLPLLIVFLYCFIILLVDKRFDRQILSLKKLVGLKKILIRAVIIFLAFILLVCISDISNLFYIPRHNFLLWIMILVFYPIWSAYPQELIFRAFFFHRYGFLTQNKGVMILLNALLFSFAHIIFRNFIALLFTFLGSLLFTKTYLRTHSLTTAFVEHSILGNLIFTVGLGEYFYLPL